MQETPETKARVDLLRLTEQRRTKPVQRFDRQTRYGTNVLDTWKDVITELAPKYAEDIASADFPVVADLMEIDRDLSFRFDNAEAEDSGCLHVTKFGVAGWGCGALKSLLPEAIRLTNDRLAEKLQVGEFYADARRTCEFDGTIPKIAVFKDNWDLEHDMRNVFNANLWLTDIAPKKGPATETYGDAHVATNIVTSFDIQDVYPRQQ